VPEVFHGGVFVAACVLLASLSLCAAANALLSGKKTKALVHLAAPLLALGFLLDARMGDEARFGIYVGAAHEARELRDMGTNRVIPLDFAFVVADFKIEYYPPAFRLCERRGGVLEKLDRAVLENDTLFFKRENMALAADELRDSDGGWVGYLSLPNERVCVMETPVERRYEAVLRITEDGGRVRAETLAVNEPVAVRGWRFYLTSHGRDGERPYVWLLARREPGAPLTMAGLWLAMAAAPLWAFRRPREKEGGAA
jgi:hypothetical protein